MNKPGPASAASMMIQAAASPLEIVERQRPPHDLTDEEVEVWVTVVSAKPADWFSPANTPLLAQYCRHIIHSRRVAELIERATGDPDLAVSDYDRLLKMQERESRAIASLATKMRVSQQGLLNHHGNKQQRSATKKPWES